MRREPIKARDSILRNSKAFDRTVDSRTVDCLVDGGGSSKSKTRMSVALRLVTQKSTPKIYLLEWGDRRHRRGLLLYVSRFDENGQRCCLSRHKVDEGIHIISVEKMTRPLGSNAAGLRGCKAAQNCTRLQGRKAVRLRLWDQGCKHVAFLMRNCEAMRLLKYESGAVTLWDCEIARLRGSVNLKLRW